MNTPRTDSQYMREVRLYPQSITEHYVVHVNFARQLERELVEALERVAKMESALREVLDHRREDKDGNYVCWIGEGTFQRCHAAVHGEPQQQPIDPL